MEMDMTEVETNHTLRNIFKSIVLSWKVFSTLTRSMILSWLYKAFFLVYSNFREAWDKLDIVDSDHTLSNHQVYNLQLFERRSASSKQDFESTRRSGKTRRKENKKMRTSSLLLSSSTFRALLVIITFHRLLLFIGYLFELSVLWLKKKKYPNKSGFKIIVYSIKKIEFPRELARGTPFSDHPFSTSFLSCLWSPFIKSNCKIKGNQRTSKEGEEVIGHSLFTSWVLRRRITLFNEK
jgi:hypothetical protein